MKPSSDTFAGAADEREIAAIADAQVYLANTRMLVDGHLELLVPADTQEPRDVHAAMRWSLFAGGKRLRPALVLATGGAFGAPLNLLIRTACAFELMHTYSLVHDDLPAMDDDDLRRGRPTCHVKFGEATAILAGDAMQAFAFQIIAEDAELGAGVRVRLIAELARAAGVPDGMVAGQARDLSAESRADVTAAELDSIHGRKTGALIVAAARAGAIIAEADESEIARVNDYAAALGLLFQITDDLLDVTATAETLGKTPGKDARAEKATYPALHGLDATQERARAVYTQALDALAQLDRPTTLLRSIARLILERRA
ncbi:MAG TPA: farnesyl diphosphate synthase [Pyrinomonadaceae bacterium]|nr:farnesyl diphosphate synthase [Pyrinomonadaceae bacterium]